jgi:hypothetical protein
VLAVLLWIVLAGVSLVVGGVEALAGRRAAEAARELDLGEVAEGAPLTSLEQADSHFSRAHALLGNPLILPFHLVPGAGTQLRSVHGLSGAAAAVAEVGLSGATEGRLLLDRPSGGSARARQVRALGELAGRLHADLKEVRAGPEKGLWGPLADARREVGEQLNQLRDGLSRADAGAGALAELLDGPRRYLVFAANNAEMRAGSGMFLQAGILETGNGEVRLGAMETVTDIPVPPGAARAEGDLAGRWGWLNPSTDWRNLMLSPRFDVSAELAAQMWEGSGRGPVDGVMSLDPVALAALVKATGPVEVGGRLIEGDSVVNELLHDQYARFPDLTQRDDRREELSVIASTSVSRLGGDDWDPVVLAREMARAVEGRHLMAWGRRPAEAQGWRAAGAGGVLPTNAFSVNLLNRGGNKLDQFIPIRANLEMEQDGSLRRGRLTITVRNETPAGEVRYITGPHFGLPLAPGEHLAILAVTLPEAAAAARFAGEPPLVAAGPDGPTRVIAFELRVPPGGEQVAVLEFELPAAEKGGTVIPSARIPAVAWSFRGAEFDDDKPRRLAW